MKSWESLLLQPGSLAAVNNAPKDFVDDHVGAKKRKARAWQRK
jgi:hypothetical protein